MELKIKPKTMDSKMDVKEQQSVRKQAEITAAFNRMLQTIGAVIEEHYSGLSERLKTPDASVIQGHPFIIELPEISSAFEDACVLADYRRISPDDVLINESYKKFVTAMAQHGFASFFLGVSAPCIYLDTGKRCSAKVKFEITKRKL